jgi:hypothetical protein
MSIYQRKEVGVGQYLKKGEDIYDGQIVVIANEGKAVEGQFGVQNVFLIKTDKKEGNVSFNQTTLNNLIECYGADSKNWVGKSAKVWAILSNVQGKMIKVYYFTHPNTEMVDNVGFVYQGSDGKKAPVNEAPPIDDSQIPF